MSFVKSREFSVRRGLCFPCVFGSILLQWRQKRGKPMWIKKLPGIVANAAVLILDIFVILMIAALFLHQQTAGERVKETYYVVFPRHRRSIIPRERHTSQRATGCIRMR